MTRVRAIAVSFLVAFAVFSVTLKQQLARAAGAGLDAVRALEFAPDFTLRDQTGKPMVLSKLAPQHPIILLNFWGTWCAPCRVEMPVFEALYKEISADGLLILAVDEHDEQPDLDRYLAERPLSFPVLSDSGGSVADRYGIRTYPTSILIGRDGRIIRVVEGVDPYLRYEVAALVRADKQAR